MTQANYLRLGATNPRIDVPSGQLFVNKPTTTVDLHATYKLHRDVSAVVHVLNAGNKVLNDAFVDNPVVGRQVQAGLLIHR